MSTEALGLMESLAKTNNGDNQDGDISILPQLFKQQKSMSVKSYVLVGMGQHSLQNDSKFYLEEYM